MKNGSRILFLVKGNMYKHTFKNLLDDKDDVVLVLEHKNENLISFDIILEENLIFQNM